MKTFLICSGVGIVAFLSMGMLLGIVPATVFETPEVGDTASYQPRKKPVEPKFPDALVPAAQAVPVPEASEFIPANESHGMVVVRPDGVLHDWNEQVNNDWAATSVAKTELVVVVGVQKKSISSVHHYPNGAPSVTRYRHDLEASVVEAKTGKVLANRVFTNLPRPLAGVERWETTSIGRVVSHRTVLAWVMKHAQKGFPDPPVHPPLIAEVD